jgi:hypothetical protein
VAAAQGRGRAGFRTTAKKTGSNASPVGRIRLSNIDDARNERLATLRQDRSHGVATAIAIKIATDLEFVRAARAKGRAAGFVWTDLKVRQRLAARAAVEQMDK